MNLHENLHTKLPQNDVLDGNYDKDLSSDDEYIDEDKINETPNSPTALDIMNLLSSHDLMFAFPNLYLVYQGLCKIPASSAYAERSFSKVYYI